ncbi:MAG: V-type ATP synthase subunit I [Planctomycetota bacterium]|jgi:V/A-type H+-transporting ATPase subunit I
MFKPARMKLVNVLLLREDLTEATHALARSACLQVEEPVILDREESFHRVDTKALVSGLFRLRTRIDTVTEILGIGEPPPKERAEDLRAVPREIAALIEKDYADVEGEAMRLSIRIKEGREALSRVDTTAWFLASLEQRSIDPVLLRHPRYIAAEIGTVPADVFIRVRDSMALAGHYVYSLGTLGPRVFVCSVTTPDRVSDMRSGLKAARFEPVMIRDDLITEGRFDVQAAEIEMWETRERLTEDSLALRQLAEKSAPLIHRWRAEIDLNMRLLHAMENFLQGRYTCLITGWIPVSNVASLRKNLEKRCGGDVEVTVLGEELLTRETIERLEPPTKLSNPAIFRPFELLVNLYGTPGYNSIDPTPVVAVTFVLIFGAMFGDIGHGAVFVLLGALAAVLSAPRSSTRDLGGILVGCGLSSVVFGFLYGSAFGYETVIEPLWTRPMEDPMGFLKYGVLLGAIIINIGLAINITQLLLAGRFKEAFFGEWGFSTLLFYWAAAFLFVLSLTGRSAHISWGLVALLLAPPLLATAFGAQIIDRIMGREPDTDLTGAVFRPIELMLASLTNTISFVRVAAFALNHAALMGAVFLTAGLFQAAGKSTFASTANIIAGNLVVIALEGLIVFVQSMRLHYYEFFGKFFHEHGHPFKPLSLEE